MNISVLKHFLVLAPNIGYRLVKKHAREGEGVIDGQADETEATVIRPCSDIDIWPRSTRVSDIDCIALLDIFIMSSKFANLCGNCLVPPFSFIQHNEIKPLEL